MKSKIQSSFIFQSVMTFFEKIIDTIRRKNTIKAITNISGPLNPTIMNWFYETINKFGENTRQNKIKFA